MNEAAAALVRRRARNLLVFVPLTALTVGVATTQFVAWKLNYHPALGSPVLGHAYWPWRIIEWWQAPWEPQVDNTFALVKFGLILTVCFGAMLALKSGRRQPRPHPTIHGTAGFADEDDIKRSGLLPTGKPGIIVGGWTDRRGGLRYLTDAGQGHAMCLGPTRSGKSAGVLVPTLLSWPHSAIVYDPKGELWQMTAGWRHSEAGNVVMRFAPAEIANTVAWNPFSRVRIGTPYAFRDVANIIQQIADPHGKGFRDHWEPTAANLMVGVALYLVETARCSLSAMLSKIDASADSETLLRAMAGHKTRQVAEVGRGMLSTAVRERASIISTARRLLALYRDPVVARNTGRSHFRIEDLVSSQSPVTLYIETRGEDELRMRPLVWLFLTLALGQLISGDGPNAQQLLLGIDEFPSLGKMEMLELFLAKTAGSGIRALLLAQDYQDIVGVYGEHERITTNCGVLSAYAPLNDKSAAWLSAKTGQSTEVVEEVSESQQPGGQTSQNRTFRSVPRPLLTADEVRRLKGPARDASGLITKPGELLIFPAHQHVIRGTQSLAFLDPAFQRRMTFPAPATMWTRQS